MIASYMANMLAKRKEERCYRQLTISNGLIDFCSNDYFGWSGRGGDKDPIHRLKAFSSFTGGATGSRLISGNSVLAEMVEKQIAHFHRSDTALLLSTGYLANVGLISALAKRGDFIVRDEFVHASTIDGCRLSMASSLHFRHNDLVDLRAKLDKCCGGQRFVLIESLYSMQGDTAPLKELIEICETYNALLIVDEAHAIGVFGGGLIQALGLEKSVFARIVTFGKALGIQGAAILGSNLLKEYLINFCRPFIYSTALPDWCLLAIREAYFRLEHAQPDQALLRAKCTLFNQTLTNEVATEVWSPIQIIYGKSNREVDDWSSQLRSKGFDVRAIKSPTVKLGRECLRICLHNFNKNEDIIQLASYLRQLK